MFDLLRFGVLGLLGLVFLIYGFNGLGVLQL